MWNYFIFSPSSYHLLASTCICLASPTNISRTNDWNASQGYTYYKIHSHVVAALSKCILKFKETWQQRCYRQIYGNLLEIVWILERKKERNARKIHLTTGHLYWIKGKRNKKTLRLSVASEWTWRSHEKISLHPRTKREVLMLMLINEIETLTSWRSPVNPRYVNSKVLKFKTKKGLGISSAK